MSRSSRETSELLLGEWACLGALAENSSHGFAIASRLAPSGDLGRVWSLSRPLTYRAIDQLLGRGYLEAAKEEPGIAGGARTILRVTRPGRTALDTWLAQPVAHLRDLRSELLLKLVIGANLGAPQRTLVRRQKKIVEGIINGLEKSEPSDDVVSTWRLESAEAARRFLDRLA